jgi:hypothetical protein
MSKVEIEVESGHECTCGKYDKPEVSKDALLGELKALLANNSSAGQADRQMKIDELIGQISELGD